MSIRKDIVGLCVIALFACDDESRPTSTPGRDGSVAGRAGSNSDGRGGGGGGAASGGASGREHDAGRDASAASGEHRGSGGSRSMHDGSGGRAHAGSGDGGGI